jgi:hypothetical protein
VEEETVGSTDSEGVSAEVPSNEEGFGGESNLSNAFYYNMVDENATADSFNELTKPDKEIKRIDERMNTRFSSIYSKRTSRSLDNNDTSELIEDDTRDSGVESEKTSSTTSNTITTYLDSNQSSTINDWSFGLRNEISKYSPRHRSEGIACVPVDPLVILSQAVDLQKVQFSFRVLFILLFYY